MRDTGNIGFDPSKPRHYRKWEERKADIQAMVDEDKSDAEIGQVYGVGPSAICHARWRLKITRPVGKRPPPCFGTPPPPPPPLVGETYVDEAGLTVTRYPARFAEGALVQSVTARPRR